MLLLFRRAAGGDLANGRVISEQKQINQAAAAAKVR
jgi:hypothetical protein